MFSQVSVILSTGWCLPDTPSQTPSWAGTPLSWADSLKSWAVFSMYITRTFLPLPNYVYQQNQYQKRMHFSKMRTACSSSRLCWGGLPKCMLGYTPLGVGLETPLVWAWMTHTPLGVGLQTPPPWVSACSPPPPPPRCGPGYPPGQTPQLPPWVWAWRPARHAGIPPSPVNRMTDRHVQKHNLRKLRLRPVMRKLSRPFPMTTKRRPLIVDRDWGVKTYDTTGIISLGKSLGKCHGRV